MHAVLAIAIAAILAVAAPAHAQDWPQRPVTIVVPFAAGGSADLLARIHVESDLNANARTDAVVR